MLFRNLLAMDVEESIRAYGMDGVVLLGGCDKTTPGQLMGAASVDLPSLVVSAGPMLNGKFQGRDIGSGTDVWKFSEAVRAGDMSLADFLSAESGMSRSPGVCMTMGTASTMASLVEAMGLALPHNGALPAVDARRKALAHQSGRRIVELVEADLRPSQLLTRASFENAIIVNAALGGSTNAVVHLLALAGRLGVPISLDDFELDAEIRAGELYANGSLSYGGLLLCWRRTGGTRDYAITCVRRGLSRAAPFWTMLKARAAITERSFARWMLPCRQQRDCGCCGAISRHRGRLLSPQRRPRRY